MRNHNTTFEHSIIAAAAYTHRSGQLGNDFNSTAPAQTRLLTQAGAERGVRAVATSRTCRGDGSSDKQRDGADQRPMWKERAAAARIDARPVGRNGESVCK
jgi:hypothetical protein